MLNWGRLWVGLRHTIREECHERVLTRDNGWLAVRTLRNNTLLHSSDLTGRHPNVDALGLLAT